MRVMGRETTAQRRDIELFDAVYRRAVERFLERVGGVSEGKWRGKAGDGFHQSLAHLAVAQENGLALIRESLSRRITLSAERDGDSTASEADLMEREPTGLLHLIRELAEEQLRVLLALPDDGLLDTPVVAPEWRRPGQLRHLCDHVYVHLVYHYQEIRQEVASNELAHWFEEWMPEASNDFYDRLLRLLPLVYEPAALGEAEQARVCIDLTQPGGGRWELAFDRSEASSEIGCAEGSTASLTASPRNFFDFIQGTSKRIKIRGDRAPASNLRALFPLA
jgi:hypothetical protein